MSYFGFNSRNNFFLIHEDADGFTVLGPFGIITVDQPLHDRILVPSMDGPRAANFDSRYFFRFRKLSIFDASIDRRCRAVSESADLRN